jgi:hypothetical protein
VFIHPDQSLVNMSGAGENQPTPSEVYKNIIANM